MPSAGALCAPVITPLKENFDSAPAQRINIDTHFALSSESPGCRIYFTTDGSKPLPFQRKISGRETTFKYIAPFTLKPGKRTLKAICVSRDGLQESVVVTKTFSVDDVGTTTAESDSYTDDYGTGYSSQYDTTDTDNTLRPRSRSQNLKGGQRSNSLRRSKTEPREAWASNGDTDYESGAYNEVTIPDGPFNPTNYAGTQINVWGAPPGGLQGLEQGLVNVSNPNQPYPVQYGYLTEQMIQSKMPKDSSVTIGDLRKLLNEQNDKRVKTPPPQAAPAIEYKPVYKDPPLNNVSAGNGDFKDNLLHIYAHMIDRAKNNNKFRLAVAEPKIGKIHEADFEDVGDGYKLTVVLAKPGVQRGTVKKSPVIKKKPTPGNSSDSSNKSTASKKTTPVKPPVPKKSDPYFAMETENFD
ncbi:hypothetical protein LOTGIDRAFT_169785, partial [Lottia gigantea]